MKRSTALVDYGSSSDEDSTPKHPVPIKKRFAPRFKQHRALLNILHRKLPLLSSSLVVPAPKDDPSQHQGRIRSTPHVEGQWAVHVYVSVMVERRSPLHQLIQDSLKTAKEVCPALQAIPGLEDENGGRKTSELHISLSRPIFVRAYQREEVKRSVKHLAQSSRPFRASFSSFSVLTNDEKTRTFVALDVGGGYPEKVYYDDPRFHASIAWALLEPPPSNDILDPAKIANSVPQEGTSQQVTSIVDDEVDVGATTPEFQRITELPESIITALNENHKAALSSNRISSFHVQRVSLKIGKEIQSWQLED
ncbi:poly(U)-specific 3'-to-5' RNA exonuclease [Marasmius crinis-equi]|uniref:U6 snRNA phosphodiesterase 1 n=1 Tax=Marasmius crinis-equi TaxID=585013 RepID=A0ABR3FUG4_9AGAR